MQYELKLSGQSEGKDKGKDILIKRDIVVLAILLLGGILISRVVIFLNTDRLDGIAPFGIAYFLVMSMSKDKRKILFSFIGVAIGYFTILGDLKNCYSNIIATSVLLIYSLLILKNKRKVRELTSFIIILLSYLGYSSLINHYALKITIGIAIINTIIVIPIYYIIRYSIECIYEFNDSYFFSSEEIVSIGILICLMVCGFSNLSILGVSLRTVLSYSIILMFTYVGGVIYGATIGIIMGLIIGICSADVMMNIAFYGILGLVPGVFKEFGKICACITYVLTYVSLIVYNEAINRIGIIELFIGIAIFFLLPKKIYEIIELEINLDKKRLQINQLELRELKEEYTEKVKELGGSLITISNVLQNMGSNQALVSKVKSETLIENLADRVCGRCSRAKQCWEKDFKVTYSSFEEVIENSEKQKEVFPNQLEKVCLEKAKLIRNSDSLVNGMKAVEVKRESLEEGRYLLSKHIKNIALSIDRMLNDFKRDVTIYEELEKVIRKDFNRNTIKYKSIFCYRDSNARVKIRITFDKKIKSNISDKEILNIINKAVTTPVRLCCEECKFRVTNNEYVMVVEEVPKFQVVSYGAITAKDGEEYMGDTYSFGRTKDGAYMTVISDGMGAGPEAGKESGMTVEIIEKFFESGFDNNTTINMVNSLMGMKFDEDEKFSTLDLSVIDLYSGEVSFLKVGAVPSFIKRGKNIKRIESNMPPFGLADELEMEPIKTTLKSGDIIVTISDGILDASKSSFGSSNWIEDFLKGSVREPKQLAEDILQKAKEFNKGKAKDDMTVVVSKISNLY